MISTLKIKNNSLIISYQTLRKSIGIIGFFLPLALVVGNNILGSCNIIEPSISSYYYTKMNHFFTGSLCAVGLFLICYKGEERIDSIVINVAACAAFAVAFFPMKGYIQKFDCGVINDLTTCIDEPNIQLLPVVQIPNFISTIHFVAAGILFICLAFISLKLFTLGAIKITKEKIIRNKIYKVCGIIILVSILVIGIYSIGFSFTKNWIIWKPLFVLESLALMAFGFSWLVKGGMFFRDEILNV